MSQELTLSVSAAYEDSVGATAEFEVANLVKTLTAKKCAKQKQTVGLTPEALLIGDIATLGYLFVTNLDPNNDVTVFTSSGGDESTLLEPGDVMCNPCGDDMQDPFVVADTAECEILICAFAR